MKLIKPGFLAGSLMGVALLLAGLTFFCFEAQARGGGGSMGGGGLSGGSFRAGGGWGEGPRGGGVVIGPQGVEFARSPRGGEAFRGPQGANMEKGALGGAAVRGPRGSEEAAGLRGRTVYREPGYYGGAHMVTSPGNWGPYYGPARNPAGAAAATALGTGMLVVGLPPGAVARTVGGQRYFFNGGTYYLPCYQGAELAYCVVPDPNQPK
jgi:hypothetical protein